MAKKRASKEEQAPSKTQLIDEAIARVNQKWGEGSAVCLGTNKRANIEVISTGSIAIDDALGAMGLPKGRICEIYGPESCIGGDTHLWYTVRRPDGSRINHKGGTIRQLWKRFHCVKGGKGNYQHPEAEDCWYSISSADQDGVLRHNKITDVVRTGIKLCYRIKTASSNLVCTADHKFLTDSGYVTLSDLAVGIEVGIHDKTGNGEAKPVNYGEIYTKPNHPIAAKKVVTENGIQYTYSRIRKSRAIFEAHLSGLSFDEYRKKLDSGNLSGITFIPRSIHVHHINEDVKDNRIENLALITPSDHGKLHATDQKMRYTVSFEPILSIEELDYRETFDLKMADPHRNYVAGGFVTHNSGKTTFCLTVAAQCQKDGGAVAFIDVEHALDPLYAAKLGVDISHLTVSQPQWGEQALSIVETYVDGGFDLVIVDSVAALTPKSELDVQMGDASVGSQSRMMSQAMRRLTARVSKNKSVVLFTNQIREKIGVMFGSPETQPGGRALKFFASVRLDIRRQAQIKAGEEIIGNETKLKVVKNKVGPPYREALFQILYNKGINHTGSLINIGTEKGIIEKKGAWYSYNGELIGQGNAAACDLLNKNPELLAEIDKKVRDALRSE